MSKIKSKLKSITAQHVCFVIFCGLIVYLFRAGDSFLLKPVWRKRLESQHFSNGRFPTKGEMLPSPIITDLESDGINEVVLINYDMKLSILALPNNLTEDDGQILPNVIIKNEIVLPLSVNKTGQVRKPVIMTTGYLIPYKSFVQIRSQVIIIVTEDWRVLCYSHDLRLLWSTILMDVSEAEETYHIKSLGAIIISEVVRKDDEGMVIVGGSFSHTSHETPDRENQKNVTEPIQNTEEDNHTIEQDSFTHFSTFALNGKDGTIRWHHLLGEFGEKKQEVKDDEQEIHWKLSLKKHGLHVGEVQWESYRDEIYKHLPHYWESIRDTKFSLGNFKRQSSQSATDEDDEDQAISSRTTVKSPLSPEHLIGYAYGGQRPHSDIEHVKNPNAVVIHNQNGIEVLNLKTGRPMTRVPLPERGSMYFDFDDDNTINQLKWGFHQGDTSCFVEIWRLQPMKERLERLSVCQTHRLFWSRTWSHEEDHDVKLPPVAIRSIARKSGIFRYLLGHHLPTERPGYDLVTLGSMGRVSSIDMEGTFHWQVQFPGGWNDVSRAIKEMKDISSDTAVKYYKSFVPDRKLMSIPVYGQKDAIVVTAWKDISLIDLREGKLLAEHSIPCHPTAPVVVGDFNNDGINDIILSCQLGYIGFTVEQKSNLFYTGVYAAAVFLGIVILACLLSPDSFPIFDDEDKED